MIDSETPKTVDSQSTAPSTPQVKLGQCAATRTGLRNLGRTCYANCVLQTLFANAAFRRLVMSYRPPDTLKTTEPDLDQSPSMQFPTPVNLTPYPTCELPPTLPARTPMSPVLAVVALQDLFARMRFGPWTVASPKNLFSLFITSCKARVYDFGSQEDPNEFMTHLLEVLSEGFLLGSCWDIKHIVLEPSGAKVASALLRVPAASVAGEIVPGVEAQRRFHAVLTGQAVTLTLGERTKMGSEQVHHFCTDHNGACPIFGSQCVVEDACKLCQLVSGGEDTNGLPVLSVATEHEAGDDNSKGAPSSTAGLRAKDWCVTKVTGMGVHKNGERPQAEDFREIHLGNDIFNNLPDALIDYQFPESNTRDSRNEWWITRTPNLWHFTLQRSMWSDQQSWKRSTPFQMPSEIGVGHLSLQNRGRILDALYKASDRVEALKRLSVWHTGFKVTGRDFIDHEKVFELCQAAAKSLEVELTSKEKLVAEKLQRYLRLASQQYKGVRERALETRERLLSGKPDLGAGSVLRLSSVWIHNGATPGHGHFWCLVRQGDVWLKINDDRVLFPSEREVEDILSPNGSSSAQCLYSALYEDSGAVARSDLKLASLVTVGSEKQDLTMDEALEFYELFSLPDDVRESLRATAVAELNWSTNVQTACAMRALANQYLNDLIHLMYKAQSYSRGREHLEVLYGLTEYETLGASVPCTEVIALVKHMPFSWLLEHRLLWLWTTLLHTICIQSPEHRLEPHKLGNWVLRAYASSLFKQLLAQQPASVSEHLQGAIMAILLERNHTHLNGLLDENQEGMHLPDLSQYSPICAPYQQASNSLKISWEVLCSKYELFVKQQAAAQRAFETLETLDVDVGYCQLIFVFVTVECVFLKARVAERLIPLHSAWIEALGRAPADLLNRSLHPEFVILLKSLVPAGHMIDSYVAHHQRDIGQRQKEVTEGLVVQFLKPLCGRESVEVQNALNLLGAPVAQRTAADVSHALEACKRYLMECCAPLTVWEAKQSYGRSLPLFERMMHVYQHKVQ